MNIINLAMGTLFLGGAIGAPLGGFMLYGDIDYKSADSHLSLACTAGAMNYLDHNEATQLLAHECSCFGQEAVKRLGPSERIEVATALRSFMIKAKIGEFKEEPIELMLTSPERDAVMQSPLGDNEFMSWIAGACLRR